MVSRRIQKFEDEIGVSLFERGSSGASLTGAGERFADSGREILQQVEAAVVDARSAGIAATGRIRIGLIASLSAGPMRDIVEAFLRKHPEVELLFFEGARSDLFTRLSHRQIDVVFTCGYSREVDAETIVLGTGQVHVALHQESLKVDASRLFWRDLVNETFLIGINELGCELRDHILRNTSLLDCKATVRRMDVGQDGIMTLVGLGMGVSLAIDHRSGVSYPGVVFVPLGQADERFTFSLAWRPENDNPALRRFLSLARIHARRALSASGP